jgi:hypothetical protein
MKSVYRTLLITIALGFSGSVFADGHCNYVQENMFAGPFQVCQMPADEALCEEYGTTDDNSNAVHGDGECSTDALVGTCDLGDSKMNYYEGDPGGLEIGCGFPGGEWVAP